LTLAFLVTCSLTAAAAGRTGEGSSAAARAIKIDNFGRVSDTYYRGAQPVEGDYPALAALGVKTVINLTSDDAMANERALTEQAGMRYVQMPMTTHDVPTPEDVAAFLTIVNDPANQPVYVHCVGGRHRTGVMSAVYRMTHDGWTGERAFKEMKQYKYGADFLHPEFKSFVYSFRADSARALDAAAATRTKSER
jgi:uncharacterized protein (TIGR01244 family)